MSWLASGRVEIFGRGQYQLLEEKPDRLVFRLGGSKLQGEYVLLHTGGDQWLFFVRKAERSKFRT